MASVKWTLAHLVTRPEVQEKLHRELTGNHRNGQISDKRLRDMSYLRAVILESLRLHPPLPLLVRDVGPDGAAAARTAPPPPDCMTVRFLLDTEEVGRNPKVWTDPNEFRPERFLVGGAGRRYCPGAGLSRIHVGCFVAALVREFEWAPPADGGGGVDLTATTALFVKVMASPLRARVMPRHMSQA
ncbi:hypothetical protein C2845_PM18G09200 [Panicum miliaceum]|uniref:Uncharacterized protein n=1 Tax=Panicum miliaceum TaxID=4540 RepID=A0A3L6PIF7_PANMI|nr:hypothetical protein C2845_PM18G09200 [Panicum miliaceum]